MEAITFAARKKSVKLATQKKVTPAIAVRIMPSLCLFI